MIRRASSSAGRRVPRRPLGTLATRRSLRDAEPLGRRRPRLCLSVQLWGRWWSRVGLTWSIRRRVSRVSLCCVGFGRRRLGWCFVAGALRSRPLAWLCWTVRAVRGCSCRSKSRHRIISSSSCSRHLSRIENSGSRKRRSSRRSGVGRRPTAHGLLVIACGRCSHFDAAFSARSRHRCLRHLVVHVEVEHMPNLVHDACPVVSSWLPLRLWVFETGTAQARR